MNKLDLSQFYVGQKVVAIKDHSQGVFKKGDEFVVLNIMKNCCNWQIDVGIKGTSHVGQCTCGHDFIKNASVWWVNQRCFTPLQQQKFPLIKLSKIMEKEKEEILIEN